MIFNIPNRKIPFSDILGNPIDNTSLYNYITQMYRHTRLTDFSLTDLQNAVVDQNLEKYGLKVGDQKTINSYTYVIAGLNVMKGSFSPYTCTSDHVGLIVLPHSMCKWSSSTQVSGYSNSDLHSYLTDTVLPIIQTELGSDHLYNQSKLYSVQMNTSGYNRSGINSGSTSGYNWSSSQYISALSEIQVYGSVIWSSSGYDTGEASQQLPVFKEYRYTEIFGNEPIWLRDIATATTACLADKSGNAIHYKFNDAYYVAGLILYH